MNYIELIRNFWTSHNAHSFSTTEIALYFYLVEIFNICQWTNQIKRNNRRTEADLDISFNTLKSARNRLQQAGLIYFKSVNGNANVSYSLSNFDEVKGKVSAKVTNEVATRSVPTKDKLNKTKQKEILSSESMEKEDESSLHPQTEFEKFNEWIKRKAPYCSNPKNFTSQITENELIKLKEKYSAQQVADVIMQIENRKDLRKKYSNLYRTVLNWLKNEQNNGNPKEAEQSTDAISRLHPALR